MSITLNGHVYSVSTLDLKLWITLVILEMIGWSAFFVYRHRRKNPKFVKDTPWPKR